MNTQNQPTIDNDLLNGDWVDELIELANALKKVRVTQESEVHDSTLESSFPFKPHWK